MNTTFKNTFQELDRLVLTSNTQSFFEWAQRWSQENNLIPFPLGLGCCALEYQAAFSKRFSPLNQDFALPRNSPSQSDLLIVAGTITEKILYAVVDMYEQMQGPKYVMALGSCSSSGGAYRTYSVHQGIHDKIPVDVYVPGCPPHPMAIISGIELIKERIKKGVCAYNGLRSVEVPAT